LHFATEEAEAETFQFEGSSQEAFPRGRGAWQVTAVPRSHQDAGQRARKWIAFAIFLGQESGPRGCFPQTGVFVYMYVQCPRNMYACIHGCVKLHFNFGKREESRPAGYVLVIAKQFFRLLIGNFPSIFASTFV